MEITVNGEKISSEICAQELHRTRSNNRDLKEDEILELARQNIIDWAIIRQNAKRGIKDVPVKDVEDAFEDMVKQQGGIEQFYKRYNLSAKDNANVKKDLEQNIKIQRFLSDLTKDTPKPTDEEIKEYYNNNVDRFVNPEQIHAAHIVKEVNPATAMTTYNEMKEVRQKLLNGADFATTAKQFSSCRDNGGDLGFFPKGKMVEEFDVVVFSMQVGEISPIFQTQYGYHIATVLGKKEPTPKSIEDSKEEIIDNLWTQKKDERIAEWVDEKKKTAEIQIESKSDK